MRFTFVASLLAAATIVTAQLDPSTISPCIQACSITAAQKAGCPNGPLDTVCVCKGGTSPAGNFVADATNCILANCPNELGNAVSLPGALCSSAGIKCTGVTGFALCNGICIELSKQSCVSNTVVNNLRRSLMNSCPPHHAMCKIPGVFGIQGHSDSFDCVDIYNDLESCGGCIGEGGVDCTAIYGAADVSCRKGKCVVSECEEGLTLVNGRCK